MLHQKMGEPKSVVGPFRHRIHPYLTWKVVVVVVVHPLKPKEPKRNLFSEQLRTKRIIILNMLKDTVLWSCAGGGGGWATNTI